MKTRFVSAHPENKWHEADGTYSGRPYKRMTHERTVGMIKDTPSTCDICGIEYMGDGYQWTCDNCRHPKKECPHCGSDDIICDWHIENAGNGELMFEPVWYTECQKCERRTVWFDNAKDAYDSWMKGEVFTPIEGTGHYEEVW